MIFIYSMTVVAACLNLGNSLESTRNQSPSQERYNFFDAELLQVFNAKKNANVLISPVSIKLVLGMLVEGAEDKTAAEIRAALRLPEGEEARRKEFNAWLSVLQGTESQDVIKMANRVFLSEGFSINPDYGKILAKYYSGGVTGVKFQDVKEATQVINTWVVNQTSSLIPSLVREGQISEDDKLMLASAVYFRGFWSRAFAPERTSIRCFYPGSDRCRDSLMMTETGHFDYGYVTRLDAKAIVLPFKGAKFSMLLLLPSRRDGVELLTRDLMHVSLTSILSELKEEEIFVQIPQFEISYNNDLVDTLKAVQIEDLFTAKANLSKMFTNHLESTSVSHIYHSAKITVDEEGSEAAAATGAMFVPLIGGTTTSFVANHPFLFFVMSSARNTVLFAGKLVSPHVAKDPKKRTLPSQQSKKPLDRNLVSSTTDPSKVNDSSEKIIRESKRGQQQLGPKFRSIRPSFSAPWVQSNEGPPLFGSSTGRRPYSSVLLEKEATGLKKRGKTVQEVPKNRKRQEQQADDWRHHVLFFT